MARSARRATIANGDLPVPGDAVGIQVPVGRIAAGVSHWQAVYEGRTKACIYRLFNGSRSSGPHNGTRMIVEVDGARRTLAVQAGASVDVLAKKIRVKAASGGAAAMVDGWYVLVS